MSGLEVIGAISAVINIIDASIKIYESAQMDLKLSQTFEAVGRRLPIITHILRTCKNDLEVDKHSMPTEVCAALGSILDACDEKARRLREIFEKVVPGESHTWRKRYAMVARRLGKGGKVDELIASITQDVQLIVNNHAMSNARSEENIQLENIIKEMKLKSFHLQKNFGICLGQAPHIPVGFFVGRNSELQKLEKILKPGDESGKQRRLVLGGIGGIGKTQLAIAYAERHRDIYESAFWLNSASEATLKDSFRSTFELVFGNQALEVLEGKQMVIRLHQWLSDAKNTQWLLIFDNYDDPSQFNIENYYPPASHGTIMVTSRRPDLVSGDSVRINPLQNMEDSLTILQTRSNRENVQSDPNARRIVERLAGLPLALATAGAYLQRSPFTFQRYLQEYEKRWNLDPRRSPQLQEYQERTLYTTWDLSYISLERSDLDAAKLLNLLAYFDNQRFWYDLFQAGIKTDSPQWLREAVSDHVNFNGIMGVLTDYCFLDSQASRESWSMHNCVHDWALAKLNEDSNIQHYMYAFDCVAACINGINENFLGYASHAQLAAHAARLVHPRFFQNHEISFAPAQLGEASRISQMLLEQIQLKAAEHMFMWTLAGYEKTLETDQVPVLQIFHSLGKLYTIQDRLVEAEQMHMRALAGRDTALGSHHISTLSTVHHLGNVYMAQGRLIDAEKMYLRALAGREKALGSDHISTLRTANNLGNLYHVQDKLDEAKQLYLRALAGTEKALGADHTMTLEPVNGLGLLFAGQGSFDEAEQMFMRALSGKEKALGADHTSTLSTVNNLGNLYDIQGKLDQAEHMYMRALAGNEKMLGTDHTTTLGIANNLGNIYKAQEKLDKAEEMYTRALAGFEKALGKDHTTTLDAVNNIGNIFNAQGSLDKAEQMYIRALTGNEKALGADHTSTLDVVINLGSLCYSRGQLNEAEKMFTRALAGYQKTLGADHVSTLSTFKNLGTLFQAQGKPEQAEDMYMRALSGRERILGGGHLSTLNIVSCLAAFYESQGELDKAKQMHVRARNISEKEEPSADGSR